MSAKAFRRVMELQLEVIRKLESDYRYVPADDDQLMKLREEAMEGLADDEYHLYVALATRMDYPKVQPRKTNPRGRQILEPQ